MSLYFYGEKVDILLDSQGKSLITGQTTELQEWILNHEIPENCYVHVGETNEKIHVNEYTGNAMIVDRDGIMFVEKYSSKSVPDWVMDEHGIVLFTGTPDEVVKWLYDRGNDPGLKHIHRNPQ